MTAEHDLDGSLSDDERDAIATALPKRRAEFVTGRVLGRRALAAIGVWGASIPCTRSGAPVWPAGFVGTITHSIGLRACAVGRRDEFAGIGIDATPACPLPDGVLERVVDVGSASVASSLEALRRRGIQSSDSVLLATAEAVAKARTSAHGGWYGIDGANITVCPDGSFIASARRGPRFAGTGRWSVDGGMALAGITLDEH
ncbi:4'-phosphopantetheinyl transferase [Curtobacterium sp. TC1]|uniref:4'-phosphopantetheinyl transferase family protein n=1 Tax=Curtobacterium sp. TC1 TaxID=2862880 RepID=UPI0021BF7ED4|nr:4-phosphopantetheinyl transferase [Curtobacterium sp. TC1]